MEVYSNVTNVVYTVSKDNIRQIKKDRDFKFMKRRRDDLRERSLI